VAFQLENAAICVCIGVLGLVMLNIMVFWGRLC
jgi:hypothetical protein